MKLIAEFEKFLDDEVNLNKARIKTLTDRVDAIQQFLLGSGWSPKITRFSPQGSWAHKTIIKPPGEQGFDADLLVFTQPVAGWSARDYVLKLKDAFEGSGTYKDKVGLHTRCVRLEYSGDFEIDVVPCVVNGPGGNLSLRGLQPHGQQVRADGRRGVYGLAGSAQRLDRK
jgi:Second Messenger Oligonucleotide or Dinucleotide Synthetase domain